MIFLRFKCFGKEWLYVCLWIPSTGKHRRSTADLVPLSNNHQSSHLTCRVRWLRAMYSILCFICSCRWETNAGNRNYLKLQAALLFAWKVSNHVRESRHPVIRERKGQKKWRKRYRMSGGWLKIEEQKRIRDTLHDWLKVKVGKWPELEIES